MGESQQRRLRYAVIGIAAGIFNSHRPALILPEVELVAASDINVEVGTLRAEEWNCRFYQDYRVMLEEARPDVVVILTPPFLHAQMTIDSLEASCHVLLEKPMAVEVAEADAMIEAAKRTGKQLGVIFQHHYRPEIAVARNLLREGVLGKIQRVDLVATWTRPDSYFRMASWRATWAGEGGGILTNQASHNLDLLCDLLGSPARVFAWTRTILHNTETEDTTHALLEWEDGLLGYVHITTAEADSPERIKIVGTGGCMEIGRGTLSVQKLAIDLLTYKVNSSNPYAQPEWHPYEVSWEPAKGDHVAVYKSFHQAIFEGKPFYASGEEARRELELANAMTYSSYKHCEISLPLDRPGYSALLAELRQQSKNNKR